MPSTRYPKRRRVSSPAKEEPPAYNSSPDELAPSSDHEKYHSQRAPSKPLREGKGRKRSYADIHSANSTAVPSEDSHSELAGPPRASEETPNVLITAAAPSEDSPDELDHTTPTFFRRPFRASFSKESRRPNEKIASQSPSPPPYSRLSSPIATPRTPPVRPPQYEPYKEKMVLKGHRKGVASVRFSPDGQMIASCSADATIRIWETATGKHLHTLEGHLAGISTIAWSPDSKTLASGSDDKSIRLWDVSTGKAHPHLLLSHSSYIYALSFSPRGNMLASGSYDEALFLWDVRTTRLMRSLPAHSDPIGGVDFVRDGTLIVSCAGDGLIRVWDTATGQCLRTLVHEDNAAVTAVRFSPNGKFVLAWTLDGCVRLWNYVEGRCVKTYQGHTNSKYSIGGAFGMYGGEDGVEQRACVVSGSEDGHILCWDVQSKEILQIIKGHQGVVLGVDTLKKEGLIVSGGIDKTVRVWSRERGGAGDSRNAVDGAIGALKVHEEDAARLASRLEVPSRLEV